MKEIEKHASEVAPTHEDVRSLELQDWCRRARERVHAGLEIYERRAWRRRVRVAPGESLHREDVEESGTAVRLRSSDGAARFAAVSGDGPDAVDLACELARPLPPEPDPGWGTGSTLREDDDAGGDLPEAGELRSWLDERYGSRGPRWIEVAWTEERWSFDGTAAARRTRRRTWARVEWEVGGRTRVEGTSARGWPPPDPPPPPPIERGRGVWLLLPEAVAPLLLALTAGRVLRPGEAVGPGLVLADEPDHPEGLAGGTFDDAGYRTVPTRLADGRTWLGVPAGPGHLLRPSYRDRPSPAPANLVVPEGPTVAAAAERTFHEMRLLPGAGGAWTLVLRGESAEDAVLSAEPADLVRRIVGTWGTPTGTRSGVRTPGLLLETRG